MALITVEEAYLKDLKKRIERAEKLLKRPPAQFIMRQVQGVSSGIVYSLTGGTDTYYFIDGMRINLTIDDPTVFIDANVQGSASAIGPTYRFVVEIDGQIDRYNYVENTVISTSAFVYQSQFVLRPGPGEHLFRLMMSSSSASTFTTVTTNRYLRILGLKYPRKES